MKKKNRPLLAITLALVIALMILLTLGNQASASNDASSPQISVIVDDSNSARWVRFRAGLEQAAKDYNVNLNYVTTTKSNDLEQQKSTVDKEIENGTNALIIQLVSNTEEAKQYVTEISKKKPVELIETDLEDPDPDNSYYLTLADNQGMGSALADMVNDGTYETTNPTVGIVTGSSASIKMRLQALQDELQTKNIAVAWSVQTSDECMLQQAANPATAIVTLDNDTLEEIAVAMKDNKKSAQIYGIGCSDKTIYNLDNGTINGMIVPNEYTMGYVCMSKTAMRLNNHFYRVEDTTVNFFKITKENLYSTENQKMIFPIVG